MKVNTSYGELINYNVYSKVRAAYLLSEPNADIWLARDEENFYYKIPERLSNTELKTNCIFYSSLESISLFQGHTWRLLQQFFGPFIKE